ncbi:MAG: tRNA uridine-5-carboxymethylaminomethyl(34) synthesis GTPase MnmE [Symbiobacterium sp.]|uniref:tRNA uridine-5-carboxymethylaminomethyl(34) synthesis GTPase MnmE n=1 Tax=Symbiobacterium sp. TaxID=1971213 RepID=UPI00346476D7
MGEDTIAAIATGAGESAIGIVRLSGATALAVADRIFRPRRGRPLRDRRSHTVTYGWVTTPAGERVDEALALVMRGPHSYTGEDVVELQCHGGQLAVRRVLEQALQAGARLAEPGEFTRRAFLNGRMDLSQAEAVIDLIRAKTDRAMAAAVAHLGGSLRERVSAVRERLLEMMAHLEADIDFPELELEVQTREEVSAGCAAALAEVERLLGGARAGRILREGLRVVLAGRPNVGKSSLLNRLVRENRAIVTAVPGTTRDVIAEWVNLGGVPVQLSDTAGIRPTDDPVERIGVQRTREALRQAHLVLVVIDCGAGLLPEDEEWIAELPPGAARIGVANKIDLNPGFPLEQLAGALGGAPVVAVSAEQGTGIGELEMAIAREAGALDASEELLVNARQADAVGRAAAHLRDAQQTLAAGFGDELVAIDLRAAWMALGEVTGDTADEALLDEIFGRFCIGK